MREAGYETQVFSLPLAYSGYGPSLEIQRLRFIQASKALRSWWPQLHREMREWIQLIVPHRPGCPKGSVDSFRGAVFLKLGGDLLENALHLIHETAHIRLAYFEERTPLLKKEIVRTLHPSPWSGVPRPIPVFVHMVLVYYWMLYFLEVLAPASVRNKGGVGRRLRWLQEGFRKAFSVLEDSGALSEAGEMWVGCLQREVRQLAKI